MLYSVILPTYNERENLPIIFYLIDKTFTEHKLKYEVVVVEDSSPDGTLEVAQKLQESYGKDKYHYGKPISGWKITAGIFCDR